MQKILLKSRSGILLRDKTIDVDTGEIKVSTEPVILQSIALGSCIAFIVYDRITKIGGLAHIMLPGKSPTSICNTKYTEDAVDTLLETVKKLGAEISRMEISVVGGANVLQEGDIPDKVIKSVLDYLKNSGIALTYMRVGGIERRSVFLEMTSGKVFYTEGNDTTKTLLNKIEKI